MQDAGKLTSLAIPSIPWLAPKTNCICLLCHFQGKCVALCAAVFRKADRMMLSCGRMLQAQPNLMLRNFCRIGHRNSAAALSRLQSAQPDVNQHTLRTKRQQPAGLCCRFTCALPHAKVQTARQLVKFAAAGTAVACLSVGNQPYRTLATDSGVAAPALLPAIDLIVGPMFAGKSTALLQRVMDLEVRLAATRMVCVHCLEYAVPTGMCSSLHAENSQKLPACGAGGGSCSGARKVSKGRQVPPGPSRDS